MSDNQNFSYLNEHHKELSSVLVSHVDELIKYFLQNNLLSESDVAIVSKLDRQKAKVDHFMNIIIDKVGKGNGNDYFDKLVGFMRDSQDPSLSDLAKKMSNLAKNMSFHYQDVNCIPVQSVVMESEKQRTYVYEYTDNQLMYITTYLSENQLITRKKNLFNYVYLNLYCISLNKTHAFTFPPDFRILRPSTCLNKERF